MLKELKEQLNKQDNRATAEPIFIVYDWERIPTSDKYSNEFMFVDGEGKVAEDRKGLIQFLKSHLCKIHFPFGILP